MSVFRGTPNPINRMLGFVDSDDPTNLPVGIGALARNMEYTMTSAITRAGINRTIQAIHLTPITGLLGLSFTPEAAGQAFFQLPMLFQDRVDHGAGSLQAEFTVGSGTTSEIKSDVDVNNVPILPLPAHSHMIGAQAYNNGYLAFSDLKTPTGQCGVYNLLLNKLDPYGMKPFGWNWLPNTQCVIGEYATPATPTGNGHTYRCIKDGTTGATEPIWPLTEGGQVTDGLAFNPVIWQESTPVMANRLASPPAPVLVPATGGTIAAAQDVYVVLTYQNGLAGETTASPASFATTTATNNAVNVIIPARSSLPGWMQGLPSPYGPTFLYSYVAIVPHGSLAPSQSQYNRYSSTGFGINILITGAGTGPHPPASNSTRLAPGQLPPPTVAPALVRAAVFIGSITISGKPSAGAVYPVMTLTRDVIFPINLAGSSGSVGTNATSSPAFGVNLDNFRFGEFNITGGNVFTFTTVSGLPYTGHAGQVLNLFAPNPQDATMSNVTVNLLGNSAGSFPAGRDVYVACTFINNTGETTLGPASVIVNTNLDDSVQATVPQVGNYTYTGVNMYEVDLPTGSLPPLPAQFAQIGTFQPGAIVNINHTQTGVAPPAVNTSGPAGAIVADTPDGGLNSTQGYRYAAFQFINRNFSVSGFTENSVIQYAVDQNGWQLSVFNIPIGPVNIVARQCAFTVADNKTPAGPFFVIGDYNPGFPSNFVYPQTKISAGQPQTATIIPDNSTTSATFNFDDSFLIASTDVTQRLRVIWPFPCVDIYYSKNFNRMFQTGVPGFYSGVWASLEGDPESFYADGGTSNIGVGNDDGERTWAVRDFRTSTYILRERSGFILTLLGVDPATQTAQWDVAPRWDKVGPCGPRAVDVCGRFMIFVHRSGVYKYDQEEPEPVKVNKEVPYWWQTVNWAAAPTIWCAIDEETQTVRMGFPVFNSTVPNQEMTIYYGEGWNNPIHFSTYSGKEISMDAARRHAWNDKAANVGLRMERTIPTTFLSTVGYVTMPVLDASYYTSQFLYGSAGPDGRVLARTPGVFHDGDDNNGLGLGGVGIDDQYETVSPPGMMAFCKLEGANFNVRGNGQMFPSFIGGRDNVTDFTPSGPIKSSEIKIRRPIDLTPNHFVGDSRFVQAKNNEYWRTRMTTGNQPDTWFEIKSLIMYSIAISTSRPPSQ